MSGSFDYLWVVLSLLTAFSTATQDACVKKFFSHLGTFEMSAFPLVYSLPLFFLGCFLVPVPPLDATFYGYSLVSIPINGVAFFLYIRAIQISPLSLTLPYLAFTPVFMILTGLIFLEELPNRYGFVGICGICVGSYVLNLDLKTWSVLSPIKSVAKEKGSVLMLAVAFLFSLTAVFGKKAILHSSVLFFSFSFFAVFNTLLCLFLWRFGKIRTAVLLENPGKGAVTGLLFFAHVVFHGWAVSLTQAAYMISVKRLSLLFGIFYGWVLFHEKKIVTRFVGGLIMLSGAVLITLKG